MDKDEEFVSRTDLSSTFSSLEESLGIPPAYTKQSDVTVNEGTSLSAASQDSSHSEDQDECLRNRAYVESRIKGTIDTAADMLEQLRSETKMGSPPRMYEVFFAGVNSVAAAAKELANIDKMASDAKLRQTTSKNSVTVTETRQMTIDNAGMMDIIRKARNGMGT